MDQTPDEAASGARATAPACGSFVITQDASQSPDRDMCRRNHDAQGDALGRLQRVDTVVTANKQAFAQSETLSDGRILTAWSSAATCVDGSALLQFASLNHSRPM